MLCQSCQVIFAFYLNYCRLCGSKLTEQARPQTVATCELASSGNGAEVGAGEPQYNTSPLTMEIGAQSTAIAEVVRQVLEAFPSLNTVRMAGVSQSVKLRSMQDTLREFSLAEFTQLERTFELPPSLRQAQRGQSITLEIPVSIERVADTVPMKPPVVVPAESLEPASARLARTCPQTPIRLHLRPTSRELNLPATVQFSRPRSGEPGKRFGERCLIIARQLVDTICTRIFKSLVNA